MKQALIFDLYVIFGVGSAAVSGKLPVAVEHEWLSGWFDSRKFAMIRSTSMFIAVSCTNVTKTHSQHVILN